MFFLLCVGLYRSNTSVTVASLCFVTIPLRGMFRRVDCEWLQTFRMLRRVDCGYRRFGCYAVSTWMVTDISNVTPCRLWLQTFRMFRRVDCEWLQTFRMLRRVNCEWFQTFRMLRRVDCSYRRFGCFAVSTVNGYRRFGRACYLHLQREAVQEDWLPDLEDCGPWNVCNCIPVHTL